MNNHERAKAAKEIKSHLVRNLLILTVSIGLAVVIAASGVIGTIIAKSQNIFFIGAFVSGMFFTSVVTVGPATVALAELAQAGNLFLVAAIGATGSVIGDLALFRLVRDWVTDDFLALFSRPKLVKLRNIFRLSIFHWLTPIIGGLIIASPLPDEIGLAMIGMAKIKTRTFILLSYSMNFLGILLVGGIARTFFD